MKKNRKETKSFLIRAMPELLHARIKALAASRHTHMNKLILELLLLAINQVTAGAHNAD